MHRAVLLMVFVSGWCFAQKGTGRVPAIPMFFEQQGNSYVARGNQYDVRVSGGAAVLSLRGGDSVMGVWARHSNASAEGSAEAPLPGKSYYYFGDDPEKWVTGVPHFGRVRYREIYEGVDLIYYGRAGEIEYDFVVGPGADAGQVELEFDGVGGVRVDDRGDLLLDTGSEIVRQRKPVAYQEGPGGRELVEAAYVVREDGGVGFALGDYDTGRTLIIDPVLDYASYLGGNGNDEIDGMAFDAAGNIYLCGINGSTSFPGGGQLTSTVSGPDAFVIKLSPDGKQVLYRTYFGGSGNDVAFVYMKLQQDGSAVVSGYTEATDFPLMNPLQNTFGGGLSDVFVTRLDPAGQITYSTYLGGSDFEGPSDVAIDKDGNIYVGGWTASANFPRLNALQSQYGGGFEDGFITKLTPTGSAMLYSTLFGGSGDDFFNAFTVDRNGVMYGAGYTDSNNLPVTNGAYQTTNHGGSDAFAVKINAAGSAMVFSTYIGGSKDDWSVGMAVDAAGSMYVGGNTLSDDFPVLSIQSSRGGAEDSFLTKLNPAGSALVHSTYLGGSGRDLVERVAVNSANEAYVMGWTESSNFPVKNAAQASNMGAADGFLYKVNAQGNALVYSTYMGGPSREVPLALEIDAVGGLIGLSGYVEGGGFPTVSAAQTNPGGSTDAWLVVLEEAVGTSAASYARGVLAPDSMGSVFGTGFATEVAVATATPLPKVLAGSSVTITDSQGVERECELFAMTPTQANFAVPGGTALGKAVLAVKTANGAMRTTIEIAAVAPGLFSANASGEGAAAANVARYHDGASTLELAAKFDGTKFVPAPIDMGPEGDLIYLILYGTGMRGGSNATATVGGIPVGVAGPVAQGQFVALDQMNLGPLPRTLIGKGVVDVVTHVGGKDVNVLTVAIQ